MADVNSMNEDSQCDIKAEPDEETVEPEEAKQVEYYLELYPEHEIKEELVIGPIVLQSVPQPQQAADKLLVKKLQQDTQAEVTVKSEICLKMENAASPIDSSHTEFQKTNTLKTLFNNQNSVKNLYEVNMSTRTDILEPIIAKTTNNLRNGSIPKLLNNNTPTFNNSCEKCVQKSDTNINTCFNGHTFSDKSHLDTPIKRYCCTMCDYKFTTKSRLNKHIRTHTGEKPYACTMCDYICAVNSSLQRHIRTHTGEKPYVCTICDYKCSDKSYLGVHIRTHTGEKPHACKMCDYKCSRKSDLVIHIRSHTGEKPFACTMCDYKCSQKCDLYRHKRTHTGEKPYACTMCGYKCSDKSYLVIHIRTHTGEKPYSCTMCDHKCTQKSDLVKHSKIHTGEKLYRQRKGKKLSKRQNETCGETGL